MWASDARKDWVPKPQCFSSERCCWFLGNNLVCNVSGQVWACAASHNCRPSCRITPVIFHRKRRGEAVTGTQQWLTANGVLLNLSVEHDNSNGDATCRFKPVTTRRVKFVFTNWMLLVCSRRLALHRRTGFLCLLYKSSLSSFHTNVVLYRDWKNQNRLWNHTKSLHFIFSNKKVRLYYQESVQ